MMKPLTILCFLLFLGGVGVGLIQLWFQIWSPQIFSKIILTDGAVFVICFVLAFLIKENKDSENIHKGNELK